MLISYNWLKDYIGDSIPSAEEIEELLTFHAFEIEGIEKKGDDSVIDVDVLPNRSSDCLSHRGIAREIATLKAIKLKKDSLTEPLPEWETSKVFDIDIRATDLMNRFSCAVIEEVKVGSTPEWLKERLEALGQKSINNIVDATNYVMFAMGQPTHAFDLDKLVVGDDGKRSIAIRLGRKGEKITILSGEEYEVDESVLHLVDGVSDEILDFAGIKGGKAAELTEETTNIVITSGNFNYTNVRKTSLRFKLSTDASVRFQNEPSRELTMYGLRDVVTLILEIAGGTFEGIADWYPENKKQKPWSVTLHKKRVNELLGVTLSEKYIKAILDRLSFSYTDEGDHLVVIPTFERLDITIEEDLVEEIGRVYGYEHIESIVPETVPLKELNARHYYSEKVRDTLISLGFSEVITSSFRKKDEVHLLNALTKDKEYLRSSLRENIEEVLDKNAGFADLLGNNDTRVFEIGTVFKKGGGEITEHVSLTLGARIKSSGYSGKEDTLLEDVLSKLEDELDTTVNRSIDKGVVEINFSELLGKLPEPTKYESVEVGEEIAYKPFSMYPHMSRDIALWVSEGTKTKDVEKVLNATAGDLRVRTTLFDEFTPARDDKSLGKDGKTSYAFRLVFQSNEKTLTDKEVNEVMDGVYKAVEDKGWKTR